MSTEYEKQLEARCAELEAQISKMNHERNNGSIQKKPIDLSYQGWKLVTLVDRIPQYADSKNSKSVIMVLENKGLFGTSRREYIFTTEGQNRKVDTSNTYTSAAEDAMLQTIFIKCVSLRFIEYVEKDGELTRSIYVTEKWKNL